MPSTVHFAIYRQYQESRRRANNSMVALLAGSQLAAHNLTLHADSDRLLPEIFPTVPHIARFNLRPAVAADVLDAAEPHLATVTVPYALAIHEDFVMQCIRWIRRIQGTPSRQRASGRPRAADMHEVLRSLVGGALKPHSSVDLELFHVYRLLRNCHVHRGGRVSSKLRKHVGNLSPSAQARWIGLTGRGANTLIAGDQAEFRLLDVFAVFAVTKELGHGVNALLRNGLSQQQWALACVDDYRRGTNRIPRSDQWGRGLIGYASHHYQALALTDSALFEAAAEMGVWPDARRRP